MGIRCSGNRWATLSLGQCDTRKQTLVVAAGEFGRTPKINRDAGRDHWAGCNSILLAGGGIKRGFVFGSSNRTGAYPATNPQKPENMAATIYHALGIPETASWKDELDRPNHIYFGQPIAGLTS